MLADAIDWVLQHDMAGLMLIYWHFIVFDLPRYVLSVLTVGAMYVVRGPRPYRPLPKDLGISFIMVGHNEGPGLEKAIRSIREQTHKNIQIVVIDDGSTDDMAAVGKALVQRGWIDVFLSTGLRGGKSGGVNLAVQHCKHEIILLGDVDTSYDREAVTRMVWPFLEDEKCGAVSGNMAVRNQDESLCATLQTIEYIHSITLSRQFNDAFNIVLTASGAFAGFRKSAVLKVGLWDVGPGEDNIITTKLRQAGWEVRFADDAWSMTDVPATFSALFRQRQRWNRSLIRNRVRKYRRMFNPFQANFRIRDVTGTGGMIFYNIGLAVSFPVYLFLLFVNYGWHAFAIIIGMHLIYIVWDTISLLQALLLFGRPGQGRLILYVPLYGFYQTYYQRFVRLIAYTSEFVFRMSYTDSYYPQKVRASLERF